MKRPCTERIITFGSSEEIHNSDTKQRQHQQQQLLHTRNIEICRVVPSNCWTQPKEEQISNYSTNVFSEPLTPIVFQNNGKIFIKSLFIICVVSNTFFRFEEQ